MRKSILKSVDEHIAVQPEAVRPKLGTSALCDSEAVSDAVEGIG